MKTSEFKQHLMEAGYGIGWNDLEKSIRVYVIDDEEIAEIGTSNTVEIDTIYDAFERLSEEDKRYFMSIVTPYLYTPVEERKEQKKYVYKMTKAVAAQTYLKVAEDGTVRFEGDRYSSPYEPRFKGEFTDAEVASYPEDVQMLFKVCEKLEVSQ